MNTITAKSMPTADGCWEWTAYRMDDGYGRGRYEGRMQLAHRISYQIHVGPIPNGMTVDHLCFNRACVNPDHLRLLTVSENCAGQRDAFKAACVHGHEFTPENTYIRPDQGEGKRTCRTCQRQAVARYQAKTA